MKDVITDNYKLLHGDCLERMKEIPDVSVDLINRKYYVIVSYQQKKGMIHD